MQKRKFWEETNDNSTMFVNFKWQQGCRGYRYDRLVDNPQYKQTVNHFEFHQNLSNKKFLVQNLIQYCSENNLKVFEITPPTFIIDLNDDLADASINSFLKVFEKNQPKNMKQQQDSQQVLQFKRKIRTLLHPNQADKVASCYQKLKFTQSFVSDKENSTYMWLLKPTFLNRGRGIHIFNTLKELEQLLLDYYKGFEEQPIGKKTVQKEKIDFVKLNKDSDVLKINSEAINSIVKAGRKSNYRQSANSNYNNLNKQIDQEDNKNIDNQNQQDIKFDLTLSQPPCILQQQKDNYQKQLNISQSQKLYNLNNTQQNQNNQQMIEIEQIEKQQQQLQLQQQIESKLQQSPRQSIVNQKRMIISNNRENSKNQYDNQIAEYDGKNLENENQAINFNDKEQLHIKRLSMKSQKTNKQNTYKQYLQSQEQNWKQSYQDANKYIKNNFNGPVILKAYDFVVQKYIEKPLLIKKRKFDIRVWVLLTHDLQPYFFKEGYIRMSSVEFSSSNNDIQNQFIHLTNNAIQIKNDNYGSEEDGNQLSFKQFEQIFKEENNNNEFNFKRDIYEKMINITKISLQAVKKKINSNQRKHTFEIFGYDYILDEDLNVYLIEVNTNPCLEESSKVLQQLLPRMLDDAFKLTIDKIYQNEIYKQQQIFKQNKNQQQKQQTNQHNTFQINSNIQQININNNNKNVNQNQQQQKEEGLRILPKSSNVSSQILIDNLENNEIHSDNQKINSDNNIKSNQSDKFSVDDYDDSEQMWESLGVL